MKFFLVLMVILAIHLKVSIKRSYMWASYVSIKFLKNRLQQKTHLEFFLSKNKNTICFLDLGTNHEEHPVVKYIYQKTITTLISWFNGVSTFMGYLMPKPSL